MKNIHVLPKQLKCVYCENKGYIENHIGSSKIDCPQCNGSKEQLKQAAEDYSNDRHATINNELVLAFIKGAEWQQEQNNKKYSEEEVDCLLDYIRNNAIETNQGWQINGNVYTNKQLIEQFKKK